MLTSAINYFLMLAIMQFNVWFFIGIVLGHGAGEMGFGRYCRLQGEGMIRLPSRGSGSGSDNTGRSVTYSDDEQIKA